MSLLFALLACSEPPPPSPPVDPGGPHASILTYNVNFELFNPDTVDVIERIDADVVFLQETTRQWEDALTPRLDDTYDGLFHPYDPDGGQGIFSRGEVEVVRRVASPVGMFPATCLRVETALGWLRVIHVHLHPPLIDDSLIKGYFTTEGKRRSELQVYLECFDGPPDLVVGDFNEGEGDAIELLEQRGLRDAASLFPPVHRTWAYTHWTGEMEGRPDHVFVGSDLTPTRVDVREEGGSDHRPLIVELARG